MRIIKQYLSPYARRIALGVGIKFVGTMMDLFLPWILSYIVDSVMPRGDIPAIFGYGGLMVLCAVVALTFNVKSNRMASANSNAITQALRLDLFRHISYLPAAQRDSYTVSSLVTRLTTDTYNIHKMIEKTQRGGIRAPLLLLGGILFAFALEPVLAMVLLCVVPLLALIVWRVTRQGVPLYTTVQEANDGLVRTVRENAIGVRVIKALSRSREEAARFAVTNRELMDAEQKAGAVMAVTNPSMTILLNTGFMLVILVGAFRVNSGLTQPGKIMAFLSYFTIILNAVLSIVKVFVNWSKGAASARRIAQVLETRRVMPVGERDPVETEYHVLCEHVSFSYEGVRNNVEDVSFCLKQGQTLGVIGPTGSGKSTLVSLLMRFYDPQEGVIRVGGDRISGIPLQELRRRFGAAFQNDVLLQDTVYENISFLRDLPRGQVMRAARAAQIADFIEGLPQGYDTPLDIRGANLSGGQKQRILIARALAAAPDILVLDDAESALDYRTDAALRQAIREEYPGTTMIIVSQRVSAIRSADLILMMEDGRGVGLGTHQQLMERCAGYRTIAEIQMGGGVA